MSSKRKLILASIPFIAGLGAHNLALAGSNPFKRKEVCSESKNHKKTCYNTSQVRFGPYINKDRLFDGSELIINVPSIREAGRLLLQEYQLAKECADLGVPEPKFPRLIISGLIEGQGIFTNSYDHHNKTKFNLDDSQLALYLRATSWLSGYVAIEYSPTHTSKVFMQRGFLTIGNLEKSPFYFTAGKMYVPFGDYTSNMVTEPMTRDLGRTLATGAEVGFLQTGPNAWHAEAYLYEGLTKFQSNNKKQLEYGADAGYKFKVSDKVSGEVGTSFISNLADSQGIRGTLKDNNVLLAHNVPALDGYAHLAIDKFNFLAEFLSAIRKFNKNNLAANGHGAKPSAMNAEASYNFKTCCKPSSVAIGYSQTRQSQALGFPKASYRAVYNINIWRDTNLALEYRYDKNYKNGIVMGDHANVVSAQFDFFF